MNGEGERVRDQRHEALVAALIRGADDEMAVCNLTLNKAGWAGKVFPKQSKLTQSLPPPCILVKCKIISGHGGRGHSLSWHEPEPC
jgi:hypothetical protein